MRTITTTAVSWLLAGALAGGAIAAAQAPVDPPAPQEPPATALPETPQAPEPPAEPQPTAFPDEPFGNGRPVIRVGQDYTLRQGDAIEFATVIFGNATIEGRVDEDVVVILGNAQLSGTAYIDGSLVVIGGTATGAAGAVVDRDLVVIGGDLNAPEGFAPGGDQVIVGPTLLGARFDEVIPWITRGLLLGRLIVPDLGWNWVMVGLFFLVYGALMAMFDRPLLAATMTVADKPLTAFAVGLLVLLLVGPVSFLLAVSVVGIVVIPFVICALIVAGLAGRLAVMRWAGMRMVAESDPDNRLQAIRSFAIGFALLCLAYIVPILGIVTWTAVGVLGLGAATLTFIAAYRRENPAPPPPPVVPSPSVTDDVAVGTIPPPPAGAAAAAEPPPIMSAVGLLSFPRAAFRDRLMAFVLDIILVLIAGGMLDLLDGPGRFFLLLLAYHIGLWTWKATTVGGIIAQLRVTRVDGAPLRFVDALVRGLSSIFSLIVLGIGAFWIIRDPERQAWHDKIAGTYVVKVPRNYPL